MTSDKPNGSDAVPDSWVDAGGLALARVRQAAGDFTAQVTSQLEGVRTQLREQVAGRLDDFDEEARDSQTRVESRIAELQAEALALPAHAQARLEELQVQAGAVVSGLEARALELRVQLAAASREPWQALDRLTALGQSFVGRGRRDDAEGPTET